MQPWFVYNLCTMFPEIQVASFCRVYFRPALLVGDVNYQFWAPNPAGANVNYNPSIYNLVGRLPRLRMLDVGIHYAVRDSAAFLYEISTMFFSIIHNAPLLQFFSFTRFVATRVRLGYLDDAVLQTQKHRFCNLFNAIKNGPGREEWKGVVNESLRQMKLDGWGLKWDLLDKNGYKLDLPNVNLIEMTNCVDFNSNLVNVSTIVPPKVL